MVTYRVLRFPAGRPREGATLGDTFTAPTAVDAGAVAAERIGTPERGMAYWLEYADTQGRWQSAGAVVGGPPQPDVCQGWRQGSESAQRAQESAGRPVFVGRCQ